MCVLGARSVCPAPLAPEHIRCVLCMDLADKLRGLLVTALAVAVGGAFVTLRCWRAGTHALTGRAAVVLAWTLIAFTFVAVVLAPRWLAPEMALVVDGQMPEELHASDHRLVAVELVWK